MKRTPPTVELIVFIAGLLAATAAGVYGYRTVGLYGDGAFASGYHRETDPKTGESLLVREVESSKGRIRHIIDNSQRTREIQMDLDGDGVIESAAPLREKGAVRVGVDRNKNGTIDAWGYWSDDRLIRAELDLDENGTVERWEYYGAENRLEKVGSSSKGDGVADTWSFPDAAGLLLKEEFDTDRDGRVDKRHFYVEPPGSPSSRVLSIVEMDIDRSGKPDRRMYYRPDGTFDRVERVAR